MTAPQRRWSMPAAMFGLAIVLFFAGGLGLLGDQAPARSGAEPALGPVAAATTCGDLPGAIVGLQARLRTVPKDFSSWASLGSAYIEQAKATADPALYTRAEGALRKSLDINTADNFAAAAGMSALAAARHDFIDARAWALKGLDVNPASATLHGTLADAETQLGNYDAAFVATQRMVDLSPDTASLTRASYAWELRGDLVRARTLMERALDNAISTNQKAFAHYYLGELALNAGDASGARRQYDAGLAGSPDHAALLEGKAKATAALGEHDAALRHFADAVARVPLPMYLIEYGELLESLGRTAEASAQYELFETAQKLFEAGGGVADAEPTLFHADHGDPARALAYGEAGVRNRPFIEMHDAYGWALYRSGRHAEALAAVTKARSLGTRSALFEYHSGMIQLALGNTGAARAHLAAALATNPTFHPLHAPKAREALQRLGAA